MAIQLSVTVRNARLDQIETVIGAAPTIEIFTGAQPASCAAADAGTLLVQETLPSDWLAAAASGSKAKLGTWSAAAIGAGVAGHFRIKTQVGSPSDCHLQGSCGEGAGDMSFDNTDIAVDQTVTVNTFNLTDGNA